MARKQKYSDYFGNRFDELGSTVRRFSKKNNRAVLALGLTVGLSALAGLGYLVFSGMSSEQAETIAPVAPIQQEVVRHEELPAATMRTLPKSTQQERIQKLIHPKKKITQKMNKRASSKKIAKAKGAQKQNLICINPAQLKTLKKNKVAAAKRR